MDSKEAGNTNTFEPPSDLIQEADCNTLLLYLSGFTKEELRVQLTRSRVLKISGSRPIGDNKTSSFQKDFPVSENIDTNKITAKFEDGILYIRQPKLIVHAPLQKPLEKPPAAPNSDQLPPPAPLKTTAAGEDSEKSKDQKEVRSSNKDEQISESSGGKKKDVEEKTSELKSGTKDAEEKTDGVKCEKIRGAGVNGIAKVVDYSKVNAAVMLKMAREKMMKILLFLFAFALGVYVNKLRLVSREADN